MITHLNMKPTQRHLSRYIGYHMKVTIENVIKYDGILIFLGNERGRSSPTPEK